MESWREKFLWITKYRLDGASMKHGPNSLIGCKFPFHQFRAPLALQLDVPLQKFIFGA
jgi:hypothetical protein